MNPVIFDRDLTKLYLQKTYRSYTISFMENGSRQKLTLDIPGAWTPFGIEENYKKRMVNLKLYRKNPLHLEIYQKISQINNFFANLQPDKLEHFLPPNLMKEIQNKQFYSALRTINEEDPLFRVYLRPNKKSPTTIRRDGEDYEKDIKNKSGTFQISLNSFWTSYKAFGLNWTLEHIELDPKDDESESESEDDSEEFGEMEVDEEEE